MKILVVSPSLPLPFGKTDARWLNAFLPGLAERGCDVVCLSATLESEERVAEAMRRAAELGFRLRHVRFEPAEQLVVRKFRSLLRPLSEFARVRELSSALEEELGDDPDVFHLEHLFTSWLALEWPRAGTAVFLHHLEVVDWEERTGLGPGDRLAYWQMRRATGHLLRETRFAIAATDRVRLEALERNPSLRCAVAKVALDPSLYEPVVVDEPIVGLIGSMAWWPSRSAGVRLVSRIWPEIYRRMPEARLLVGGRGAEKYLGHLFPAPGAELVRSIEHPRDFFSRIGVLVYPPMRGSGMKMKVLESLAYGVPVVSNAEGLEGLAYEDGRDAVHAESDEEFVERTVELLRDRARRQEIGHQGRLLVERDHSRGPAVERLLSAYHDLLGNGA